MVGTISFDREAQALKLCEVRASLIAKNIANANTPSYKSQDINFKEAMQQVKINTNLQNTNPNHISSTAEKGHHLYYRVPMQNRMDGNTVDDDIERKNFVENSLKYQTSLGFAERKAAQLIKAIRGD